LTSGIKTTGLKVSCIRIRKICAIVEARGWSKQGLSDFEHQVVVPFLMAED